ncbi:MAG: hypothetical protein ACP5I1_11020 [Candidatus Hinthialibacter sp.]
MTAADAHHKTTTNDSLKRTIYLWIIPVISWGLLIAVFTLVPNREMVKLISSDNPTILKLVRGFLESENVPFKIEGNSILIQGGHKDQIWFDLSQQDWFDPGAGWDRGAQTPISRLDNVPPPDAAYEPPLWGEIGFA